MLSRVGFWGAIRTLQSDINMSNTPAFSFQLINEDLSGRAAAGVYFR
jgi:hypothetical protein